MFHAQLLVFGASLPKSPSYNSTLYLEAAYENMLCSEVLWNFINMLCVIFIVNL